MLTLDQIEIIATDYLLGKEPRITGKEADDFRKMLEKDVEFMKKNGGVLELPFDYSD